MTSIRYVFYGAAVAISLLALGCGDSPAAYVRSVNASPGLQNYTIQVGLQGVASSLKYGTEGVQPKGDNYSIDDSSGNYRPIPADPNQKLALLGAGNTVLSTATQSFLKNTYSTIVTLGSASSPIVRTLDDGDTAPAAGNFKLRVMQTAQQSGPVDVYITAQNYAIGNIAPVATGLQFGQVTQTYVQHAAGPVEVQVTPAGNPTVVLCAVTFTAAAGDLYTTYFLDPPPASNGYGLLVVSDPVFMSATTGS